MGLFEGKPVVRSGLFEGQPAGLFQGQPVRNAKDAQGHGSERKESEWPSWQENLFGGPGARSLARQRSLFGEPAEEAREKPHPGAPGQQVLPFRRPGQPVRYAAGRWITIGGHKGEDGKRKGGSPVYIENGRITKGSPKLTGKKIDALKDEPESVSRRKENQQSRDYERAKFSKQAKAEGIEPKHLHQLAGEMLAHDKEYADSINHMLKRARALTKKDPRTFGSVSNLAHAFQGGDVTSIRGFDLLASQMAHEYADLFAGLHEGQEQSHRAIAENTGPGNHIERLYELLQGGSREPMSDADAYEQAMDVLREHQAQTNVLHAEEEPVPFQQHGWPVRYSLFTGVRVERMA